MCKNGGRRLVASTNDRRKSSHAGTGQIVEARLVADFHALAVLGGDQLAKPNFEYQKRQKELEKKKKKEEKLQRRLEKKNAPTGDVSPAEPAAPVPVADETP